MTEPKEIILSLPASFVAQCPGLSFDIGGSVAKFVYRVKEDMEPKEREDRVRSKLRLVSFSRADLEAGLEWINTWVQMTPPRQEDGLTHVYGTGLGTGPFGARLKEKLNIQVNTLMEFDCFVEAHRYLYQHLPWNDIENQVELSLEDKGYLADYMNKHIEKFEAGAPTNQQVYLDAARTVHRRLFRHILDNHAVPGEEDGPVTTPLLPPESPNINEKYPAILATMGSAFVYIKLTLPSDEKFQMVDFCNRGGKTFMSLGSLLLGVKNYDELVDLAEKGDYRNVTKYDETGDFNDVSSFALARGKSVGDFKREDIADALLFQTVQDCVQNLVQLCAAYDLRNVMLAGGFVSHPYVRRVINREWCRRLFQQAYLANFTADVAMRIMQHGSYFGAIGCMINSVHPFRPM